MKLQDLILGLGIKVIQGDLGRDVSDITDDSRACTPGCLFIARSGSKADGSRFIADAIAKGAASVLAPSDPKPIVPESVALLTPGPAGVDQRLVNQIAQAFFGHPAKKLKLIGVTGTNGKTTITFVIQHLLARVGLKTGVIGTVVIDDGASRIPAELTTPSAIDIARHMAAMVKNGCSAMAIETSSHALHQGRTAGLSFDVGIFTNLTGDHLDYHKTMDNYAAAKAILFEGLPEAGFAVVNVDDSWAPRMLQDCKAKLVSCSLAPESPDQYTCHARILSLGSDHSQVRFAGPWGQIEFRLPLVGRHNVINVLQAAAAANCIAPLANGLQASLEECPAPPGRLEPVRIDGVPKGLKLPAVLVDYAHTHDALENVLSALGPVTQGRIITVFGCGGDRDRTKRPKMAGVACRLSDEVYITSDNPRTEDAKAIIDEILTGVPAASVPTRASKGGTQKVHVEPDRATAIALAVAAAGPDDVVLIAGKGHEDYQIIGKTKRHFSDLEEAAKALKARLT